MVRNDLPVLAKLLLLHVPSRVILRSVLVDLLVQMNRSRHTENFVVRVESMTTKHHGFGDTSDRHDRGCVSKGLLNSRCEKREFRRRRELVEMIFNLLIRVLLFPGCGSLVNLFG